MSRRVRLVLLMAALAAGPTAVSPPALHHTRTQVNVVWVRIRPVSRPQQQNHPPARPVGGAASTARQAPPDHGLLDRVRHHTLFQRPPPCHS